MQLTGLLRYFLSGLIASVLLPWAVAQQGGQTGDSTDGSGARVGMLRPPTAGSQPDSSKPLRPNLQVLFITGTVVQGEGTPLPLDVVIERNCGGRVRREASVDSSGNFSFQVGFGNPSSSLLPEASDDSTGRPGTFGDRSSRAFALPSRMGSMSSTNLIGCELRARAAGYQSSTVNLHGSSTTGVIDVGTIVLHPMAKVQGTLASVTNMQAPKAAKKALERAQRALQKRHFEEAEKDLKTALKVYPAYAAAWLALGEVYQRQQRNQEARTAYTEAISADRRFVSPYIQLARLAAQEQNWKEVADFTDRALELDPLDFPEGFFFNSLAYYSQNKLDIAERSARKALRLDSFHRIPQVYLILAYILRQKQDIAGAAEQLRNHLKFAPATALADRVRSQLQELENSSESSARMQPEHP